jgi:hypothetical protein
MSALRSGAHAGAPFPTGSFSYFYERNFGMRHYSVCHKFFPLKGSQIHLTPPFSKGDFPSNSLQYPPFF